jgi:hypothetical protein
MTDRRRSRSSHGTSDVGAVDGGRRKAVDRASAARVEISGASCLAIVRIPCCRAFLALAIFPRSVFGPSSNAAACRASSDRPRRRLSPPPGLDQLCDRRRSINRLPNLLPRLGIVRPPLALPAGSIRIYPDRSGLIRLSRAVSERWSMWIFGRVWLPPSTRTKGVRTVQEPGRRPIKLHPPYLGTGGLGFAASELLRERCGFAFRAAGHFWCWRFCPVQSSVRTTAPTVSS